MAVDKKIAAELAALRADIEALKAQQTGVAEAEPKGDGQPAPQPAGGFMDTAAHIPEQFREFETAIRDLAEAVETDIAEHPVAAVGGAFLLGVLIGRLSAR
jgi:ElaB/YqjD/DUF883 family membrane-anchored ribosome-binding protein